MKIIIKKIKVIHILENKIGRDGKAKVKTPKRKLLRAVSKDSRITVLRKYFTKKTFTSALHRNRLRGHRSREIPFLQKKYFQVRLEYGKDNLEKDDPYWK